MDAAVGAGASDTQNHSAGSSKGAGQRKDPSQRDLAQGQSKGKGKGEERGKPATKRNEKTKVRNATQTQETVIVPMSQKVEEVGFQRQRVEFVDEPTWREYDEPFPRESSSLSASNPSPSWVGFAFVVSNREDQSEIDEPRGQTKLYRIVCGERFTSTRPVPEGERPIVDSESSDRQLRLQGALGESLTHCRVRKEGSNRGRDVSCDRISKFLMQHV